MIKNVIVLFLMGYLFTCKSKPNYKYWDISKFRIEPNALQNDERVNIIYSSGGPDANRDFKYYFHLVAVSLESGDTVNILTTEQNLLNETDDYKIYNYFNENDISTKLAQMNLDSIESITHTDQFDKIKLRKPKKVVRDPEFDMIGSNNFPTVIGSIGKLTTNQTENN